MSKNNHDHPVVLRLTQEMFEQLTENRRMAGVPVSEFIRRAISLAMFADNQAANRNAEKTRAIRERVQKISTAFRTQHSERVQ